MSRSWKNPFLLLVPMTSQQQDPPHCWSLNFKSITISSLIHYHTCPTTTCPSDSMWTWRMSRSWKNPFLLLVPMTSQQQDPPHCWSTNPQIHIRWKWRGREHWIIIKDHAHRCIESLGGVRMTNSEGLWPQLIYCAPHLSMVPLISDKVQ
jgi:hypothetical protein